MSGLSSLAGAPSPFGRGSVDSGNKAAGQSETRESLSSLSSAPPISGRGNAAPSSSLSKPVGRVDPMRASTPVFSSSKANKNDDDDELFPKPRGLMSKDIRKTMSTKERAGAADSDSDDDLPFPTKTQPTRKAPDSAVRSSMPVSTASSNPILAMLDDDDDDELLKGLAPPKKSPPPTASSSLGPASSSASSLARTTSGGPPRRDAKPAGAGAAAVSKSVDALMSFLNADDDIMKKPLPVVEEEPDLFGGRSSSTPRRGRRAGGDADASPTDESPVHPSSTSPVRSSDSSGAAAAAVRAAMASSSPATGSGFDFAAPGAGAGGGGGLGGGGGGQRSGQPAARITPAPINTSASALGPSQLGGQRGTAAAATSARSPSPRGAAAAAGGGAGGRAGQGDDEDSSDLSDSDLPGMDVAPARSTTPPLGRRSPTGAAGSRPFDTSADRDAELDLPDSSYQPSRRAPAAAGGAAGGAGASVGASGGGSAVNRGQPSRLQQSSSSRERHSSGSPQDAGSSGLGYSDDGGGDAASGGYTPSFGNVTRSAPNPFGKTFGDTGQRQRRPRADEPIHPSGPASAAQQQASSSGAGQQAKSKEEEERQRTASAMAAALARREQLQASGAVAPAPGPTSFRLPSEKRATDVLPPGGAGRPGVIVPVSGGAGNKQQAGGGSRSTQGRSALQALDSSTDDDMFSPPLQRTLSPSQSIQNNMGQMPGSGMQRAATAKGPVPYPNSRAAQSPLTASAPNASQLIHGAAQPAHHHVQHVMQQPLSTQQSAPPVQHAQHNHQQHQQQYNTGGLPPGVSRGTAHVPHAGAQHAGMSSGGGAAPGVYPHASSHPTATLTPVQGGGPPPGIVPISIPHTAPAPGMNVTHIGPMGAAGVAGEVGQQQLRDMSDKVAVMQVELEKGSADASKLKVENSGLSKQVADLEAALREKDMQLREAENRIASLEARSKLSVAEVQAMSLKESTLLRSELEDCKASLSRVKAQYSELEQDKAKEVTRIREEMEAARQTAAAEASALRDDIAGMIVAAEARGRRAGMIEKEVVEAQLKAQQAALEEEKEVVHRHRLSSELLAQLTEKVRAAASSAMEREERAVRAMERDVADRDARLKAHERFLTDREDKLSTREKELDSLRADLTALSRTLEAAALQDKEEVRRELARLSRESARVEALQGFLVADKDDLRAQTVLERKLLEEAREARRKERELLLDEVSADRKALAQEHAEMMRTMDASRAELLHLKSRVVEYEARAGAALQQALTEEQRVERAKQMKEEELAAVSGAKAALLAERQAIESEASGLVEYARKLQQQSADLAASHVELEALKAELVQARQEAARELAEARGRALELQEQERQAEASRKALDRDRLSITSERQALNEDRLAASRAAGAAREAQLKLAEAVRHWISQGVPIPFTVEGHGPQLSVKPLGFDATGFSSDTFATTTSPGKHTGGSNATNNRRNRAASTGPRSRNSLRHLLDKMGVDLDDSGKKQGPGSSSHAEYIRQQKQFLTQLRMGGPAMNVSASLHHMSLHQAVPDLRSSPGKAGAKAGHPHMHHPPELSFMAPSGRQPGAGVPFAAAMPSSFTGFTPKAAGLPGQGGYPAVYSPGRPYQQHQHSAHEHTHAAATHTEGGGDTTDRGTAVSADFTPLMPVSATTSEHDGVHSHTSECDTPKQDVNTPPAGSGGYPSRLASAFAGTQQAATFTIPEGSSPASSAGVELSSNKGGRRQGGAEGSASSSSPPSDLAAFLDAPFGAGQPGRAAAAAAAASARGDLTDTAMSPLMSAGVHTPGATSNSSKESQDS